MKITAERIKTESDMMFIIGDGRPMESFELVTAFKNSDSYASHMLFDGGYEVNKFIEQFAQKYNLRAGGNGCKTPEILPLHVSDAFANVHVLVGYAQAFQTEFNAEFSDHNPLN